MMSSIVLFAKLLDVLVWQAVHPPAENAAKPGDGPPELSLLSLTRRYRCCR